jgi:hypothetical protein
MDRLAAESNATPHNRRNTKAGLSYFEHLAWDTNTHHDVARERCRGLVDAVESACPKGDRHRTIDGGGLDLSLTPIPRQESRNDGLPDVQLRTSSPFTAQGNR